MLATDRLLVVRRMPCALGVLAVLGPVLTVRKELTNFLKPHCKYVKNLDSNFDELEKKWKDLSGMKKATSNDIFNKQAKSTPLCSNWFDEAWPLEKNFLELQKDYRQSREWNWQKRRKLGSKIVKTTKDIVTHMEKMHKLVQTSGVMTESKPKEPKHDQVVELESLKKNLQNLLEYVRDENVKTIGVWGMAGMGKTTLLLKAKEAIEACKKDSFDKVIWIKVRGVQEMDVVKNIQKDILRELNLSPTANGNHNAEENADKISKALKEMKYLVFLDRVCSSFNLEENVGIPLSLNRGTVVLASTSRDVCREMEVEETIHVISLGPEDIRTLFLSIARDVIERNERIKYIFDSKVGGLVGHPGLIKALATTLKKDSSEMSWETTLKECDSPILHKQSHLEELQNTFKATIDRLLVGMRICLEYMPLFPRGYEINEDYLMECWIIQRFPLNDEPAWRSHNEQTTFREARYNGRTILNSLTDDYGLLERSRVDAQNITVPEHVRKALKHIISNDRKNKLLVEAGPQIDEYPQLERWWNAKRISLMFNRLRSLPRNPKCPKNSTLFLQNNMELKTIQSSFFANMSKLQLLDLCQTGIKSLPKSLFKLVKLRGLYLNQCKHLTAIPKKIEKLKNLEILDIRETTVSCLPIQIGKLGNLKCFRVSLDCNCADEQQRPQPTIPLNLVQNLHQLEELTIILDCTKQGCKHIDDTIAEVASLKKLTTLCFHFPNEGSLKTFVKSDSFKDLKMFKILVGRDKRILSFAANEGISPGIGKLPTSVNFEERLLRYASGNKEPQEIRDVLKQAKVFELIGHSSVQSLSDFGEENMISLEFCLIKECTLKCIWQGPTMIKSLGNLTTLILNGCHNLTKILSCEINQQLGQLQCLKVQNCSRITEIIEVKNPPQVVPAETRITEIIEAESPPQVVPAEKSLSKLETVELFNLPSLVSICRSDMLSWPKLLEIAIDGCPELCNLSLSTTNAKLLNQILCNREWWDALQLQHGLKQCLESHCRFIYASAPYPTSQASQGHNTQQPDSDARASHVAISDITICHYNDCINGSPPYLTPQASLGRNKSLLDSDACASHGASAIRPALASSSKSVAVEPPNDPSSSSYASQ